MQLQIDKDLHAVIEFMQGNIPANKLMSVAEKLPDLARVLWSHFPQELCVTAKLETIKLCNQSPLNATEYDLAPARVGGDFVAATGAQ
jgi:hypothetical protein